MPESSGQPVELTCERCGAHQAREVAGTVLCDDCYIGAGSCCPGWGDDEETKSDRCQPN